MNMIQLAIQFILHIDQHLLTFVNLYGAWTYAVLFLIIFCETGLVVTPALPGDSMLFAAGAISANTSSLMFNVHILFLLLVIASITGNTLNYFIGKFFGNKLLQAKVINPKYYEKSHQFYQRYGGKTIIIARFIPIVRTFAPFMAGISQMSSRQFTFYNVIGAVLWIGALLYAGFLFSNIAFIKNNFSLFILAVIVVSLLPPVFELLKHINRDKRTT